MGAIAIVGWLLALVGGVWLIVVAVQTGKDTTDKVIWGLVNFFCQPLGGIVFYFVKKQGMVPLLVMIIGFVLMIVGGGMTFTSSFTTH